MTPHPPPIFAQSTQDWSVASADAGGFAFPGSASAPRDATLGFDASQQSFAPNYTDAFIPSASNTVEYTYGMPDPSLQYDNDAASWAPYPVVNPPSGAFVFGPDAQYQYVAQDATHSAHYTLPQQDIYRSSANKEFMPLLPPSLPQYPSAPQTNNFQGEDLYHQQQQYHQQQHEYYATHPNLPQYPIAPQTSDLQGQDLYQQQQEYHATYPRQSAPAPVAAPAAPAPVPRTISAGKRRRTDADAKEDLPAPKKRQYRGFGERHPEIEVQTHSFRVKPQGVTVFPTISGPAFIPPPPPAPANQASQQQIPHATQPDFGPQHAANGAVSASDIVLYQVPLGGIPPYTSSPAAGAAPVVSMGRVRIDNLRFGKHNKELPRPLPANFKVIVRIISGRGLAILRAREGVNFYGNELYNPRTGEVVVLRIMTFAELDEMRAALSAAQATPKNPAVSRSASTTPVPSVPAYIQEPLGAEVDAADSLLFPNSPFFPDPELLDPPPALQLDDDMLDFITMTREELLELQASY
ncbi:hypothetical protein B0H17DRAFT_1075695 [Mycena rosella]|uniref:Uncharacterized protein n=1 Tax=Mycena rosella TaxID=1033263 RepID=A0AAD7GCI6_MYCRO|nr:hypothetical protein B0H17DRAFT_1075695 [Mycena rosella]